MRHTALSLHRNASFPASMADVSGYDVRTRDNNEKVGKVSDLVCAPDGQLRYLDIGLGGLFNKKRVLLPIGVLRVDRQNDVVWVAGMTKEQVKELPDYDGNPDAITDDYETQCCGPYLGRGMATAAGATTTEELYDQGRFYADRSGEAARGGRLSLPEEQLDESGLGNTAAGDTRGGTARRGASDLANTADDVKGHVGGPPASRPGPDAADRDQRI